MILTVPDSYHVKKAGGQCMFYQILIGLVGGLGLFLFGMQMMASGMQKAAGDKLRRILEILTSNPYIATVTGIIVTVLVQSSSTTTIMVVGFANAGLMTLNQAVGTILGANIGTTITAQMVSFKVGVIIMPAIGIGSFLNFFGTNRFYKYIGQGILGFGILFLGMSTMSEAMAPLRDFPPFINMLASFGHIPVLGVLAGALFTAAVQSSSAASGVIIALTLQGLVDTPSAIALILGTNIGTCISAILASIGTSLSARRAALAHVLFNTIGVVLVLILFNPFLDLIQHTGTSITRQVANAHTIFNVFNTMIMFPFLKPFVRLITYLIPGEEKMVEKGTRYLDRRMLKTPSVAIGSARQEILRMGALARELLAESVEIFLKNERKLISYALQKEDLIDNLEKDITTYLADMGQHSLSIQQSQTSAALMHATNDLERIGDHAQNIIELAEAKIDEKLPFSEAAINELRDLYNRVDKHLAKAITAFEKEDKALAREVIDEDDIIDNLERTLRKHHIDRINEKKCLPKSGVIYLDLLSNFERIADHGTNLAQVITGDF
jgi:phosphate:Na+ symporter